MRCLANSSREIFARLFDHPFVDENLDKTVRRSQEHLDLSLEVARQSMCLLKNQNNLLPLKKDLKRVAVIGPNAELVPCWRLRGNDRGNFRIRNVEPDQKNGFAADGNSFCRRRKKLTTRLHWRKKRTVVILGLGEIPKFQAKV